MSGQHERLYLGVDAGGTSCRARLETADGTVLGAGKSGAATLRLPSDIAANSIIKACTEALSKAGLPSFEPQKISLAIGAAGSECAGATEKLHNELSDRGWPNAIVTSDARTACIGAHQGADGGIVIVGTGSIGYGLIEGEPVRTGGLGFPKSDLGSGAHIGLQAVQTATQANSSVPNDFLRDVRRALGGTQASIAEWQAGASATTYATLAPLVVEHAQHGDKKAIAILSTAAAEISTLISRLNQTGVQKIALVGGLAPIIQLYLSPDIQAALHEPLDDAVSGAILLAKQRLCDNAY